MLMIVSLLSGCKTAKQADKNENLDNKQNNTTNIDDEKKTEKMGDTKKDNTENTDKAESVDNRENTGNTQTAKNTEKKTEFSFADISNLEFWYGSGAGAWCTTLTVNDDGTFEGNYHDSDMGDSGDDFPNGTCYSCTFIGKFTEPEQVNAYTYSVKIDRIDLEKKVDTEEIRDGVKYIYSQPYGVYDATEILFYKQGAPIKELPEEYRSWVGYGNLNDLTETELPFYGLFNVNTGDGFSSTPLSGKWTIDDELASVEQQAGDYENKLEHENLTQLELNTISGQLYQLWDDELNWIWFRIKAKLDSDSMNTLTKEEKKWITYKEKEIEKAGAQYEGGTMQPMEKNMKGAELTKKRVYELAEYLR